MKAWSRGGRTGHRAVNHLPASRGDLRQRGVHVELAVDEVHQVELRADDGGVSAVREHRGHGDRCACEGMHNAVLPAHGMR